MYFFPLQLFNFSTLVLNQAKYMIQLNMMTPPTM